MPKNSKESNQLKLDFEVNARQSSTTVSEVLTNTISIYDYRLTKSREKALNNLSRSGILEAVSHHKRYK